MTKYILSTLLMLHLMSLEMQAQPCEITEITAVALPCNGNNFSVTLDLEVMNPASPGFTLAGNGVIYGTYLYTDLPVTVGPLLGDDESTYHFIAWDVENAECQAYASLAAANCGPICSISNFELNFITCQSNQSALIVFDFDYENPSGVTFDLFTETGTNLGPFLYSSLPVTLQFFQVYGASAIVLTVCDHNNAECCETFTLPAIDCNPNNCEIFDVSFDPECTGSNFLLHINFGYDNPASDSFNLTGNTLNYGRFGYNELPITVGPLNGSSNINWEFVFTDSGNASCTRTEVFGIYHCPPPCNVLDLQATALECLTDDAYSLKIEAAIEGQSNSGFSVFSQTKYYGSFAYNTLPITIPAFESGCEAVDYVSICDNTHPGCCETILFEALQCCGCLIYNLTATPLPCNDNDEIFVQINFSHYNTSSQGFEISGNQTTYGTFSYESLPVLVGPFPGNGSQYFEFVVTDLNFGTCLTSVELGEIGCQDICEISNLEVVVGNCSGHQTFELQVDFDFQAVTGNTFDLFANGIFYNSFNYTALPLSIEDFPASGTGFSTIKVCDTDNPNCCSTLIVTSPDCECQITDATIQVLDCIDENAFSISLDFFAENLPVNFVDVFLNGLYLSTYNALNTPLTIPIQEGEGIVSLSVCATNLGTCCAQAQFVLKFCDPVECTIWDLSAEIGECNSNSTFPLDIAFNEIHLPTDSVIIYANNDSVGKYQVHQDAIHIEHFPVVDADTTILIVCADQNPECCDTLTFATPDCDSFGVCRIWDLEAVSGLCTTDSTYTLNVNFQSAFLPSDSITISSNSVNIGQFQVHPDGLVIEHFPVADSTITILIICASGDGACCDTIEFLTPDCTICHLSNLVAEPGECISDTSYELFIQYNVLNLLFDSVVITANGEFMGHFPHHPDGITIQNFPLFSSPQTTITVCALGNEECCDVFEFETPECGQCRIFELSAEIGTCSSGTTFVLDVSFLSQHLPSDFVNIYSNGHLVGQYLTQPEFIRIDSFPREDSEETTLTVCADGDLDCCTSIVFETPFCTDSCIIYNVVLEVLGCNSDTTLGIWVNFQHQNITEGGFDMYSSQGYLGYYTLDQIPVEILHYPSNTTGDYVLTICEANGTQCCTSIEFEGPICQPIICDIFNITHTLTPCDSADNFYFILDFDSQFTGNAGFDVAGNNNVYGNFNYEDLPINIGPFPTDNTLYEFLFIDAENPACFKLYTPGMVTCKPDATTSIDYDEIFTVFNNGTIPGIYAKKDIELSLFNANGKNVLNRISVSTNDILELRTQPPGIYIAIIKYDQYFWPIKLVKSSN